MVRRAVSSTTEDSLKENSGIPSSSASGKGKEVKRERGLRNGHQAARRAQSEEQAEDDGAEQAEGGEGEAEDADDAQEGEDEEEADGQGRGSPKGHKRARANTNGDAHPSGSNVKLEKVKAVTLPRDDDGYIPGSIVRVQLTNFVTYDYVEFSPGPYLNMILGPNGTGKSSIACAICIGLNFPPSLLGRANELGDFVKIGTPNGHIEIELKGRKGKPNLVVRRYLTAGSKTSRFTINGESASGREVSAKMAELNVQVSNLCTFLPQDRVAEFARMTPQQLLKETQRAAGNENLSAWHNTLVVAGKDLKKLQEGVIADRKNLATAEERNAGLEREVKRYEERKAIEKRIALLEVVVPAKQYREAQTEFAEAREARGVATKRLKVLLTTNAPVKAFKEKLTQEKDELGRQRDAKKAATRRRCNQLGAGLEQNERLEAKAEQCKLDLDSLKTKEKTRQNDIKAAEKQVTKLETDLESAPPPESPDEVNEQIRTVKIAQRQLHPRQSDLQERQRACVDEEARFKADLETANRSLRQLDNVAHQKLQTLQQMDPNCAKVVVWLRQNQDKFKMEVMEPPLLSVTVPNKAFAQAVESCFNNNQLKTFVMQCDEDYRLFNRLVCDSGEALGSKVAVTTWARPHIQISQPSVTPETLQQLGFDGYALDFVKYPEGLARYLQAELQLHRTAVGRDPRKIDPTRAMDVFSMSGSARYIIGTTINNVSRSKYGKQLSQNSTYECRPPRVFISQNVDPEVKKRYQSDASTASLGLEQIAQQFESLGKEEGDLKAENRVFEDQITVLQQRKDAIIRENMRVERLRVALGKQKDKLRSLQNAPPLDVERGRLKTEIIKLAKARLKIVSDYKTWAKSAIAEHAEATKLSLQCLQIGANLTHLTTLHREGEEKEAQAQVEYHRTTELYHTTKKHAKAKLTISQTQISAAEPEINDAFKVIEANGELDSKTAVEWEEDLDTEKQKLGLIADTGAGSVEQYQRRKEAIEKLQASIADQDEKIKKKERAIQLARDNWEPALTKLVESVGERFSAAFDRIGCAGEIRISQHEDYEKWAIDILVKFRDNEKLQLLTGERQSGGERSLTTIMYLMSLTEEARTPFSLVDEINQGMDARAERAVHNSLVEVTCKADSGQYFLITPKLLPDLQYHERMKVLCVNNGEWLPEDVNRGNMMNMIDNFVRVSRGQGSSAA
ncbi:Structural maintenance of chromosomes protein 5 [Steccherinum ochraceum]|uniref:Structural maintenance of chromosomes protein 5 n=1 Tax=Steccherinum ochraceum TaxID=92696 RepID=A0A4R0R8Y8_9APHY|nr:Structural maintenance of chromosomes protein 5 [Steccherinum ochraceum]